MRQKCVVTASIAIAALTACAGVSPRPIATPIEQLPSRELDDAQQAQRDRAIDAAIAAVVQRRYAAARAAAEEALQVDPRAARARAVLGMVLLQEAGEIDPPDLHALHQGEVEVLTAEELAPGDAFVGWIHAVFLAETGHMSAAAAAAEAALGRTTEAPPTERAALLGVAGTYRYELGEDRAALPHLQAYVVLRPDDATANFRLGNSHLRISQLVIGVKGLEESQRHAERAARAFERCFQLAPGDEDAGLSVGKALARAAELAGRRGDAEQQADLRARADGAFAVVADRFPASAEPWFCTGALAERRDDPAAAVTAYEQALQRDPAHLPSLLNLAVLREAGPVADEKKLLVLLRQIIDVDAQRGGLTGSERERVARRLAALEAAASRP
ncbi:MAG: tetratricopeptide repeat protein [Planctomycetes bacterium]|nr:tetratricopeptide repeat protein [Planctomycetota bacterium]